MRRPRRSNSRNLSIVIPAAGVGRRMKSFGPKSLIELGDGQTVLSRQLHILRSTYPTADIVLVLGHEADRIIRSLPSASGIKVVENENHSETNVARSLAMGIRVAN